MAETRFKIYSLLVVKNEADIIGCSLRDACRWSDKVIVLDNGSTDGTWEEVNRLAQELPQVVVFGRHEGTFNIGLRARLFRAFRHEMKRGDWWCIRLDADEFYPGDVRAFLSSIPRRYQTVKKSSTDYLVSRDELPLLNGDFEHDRPLLHHTLSEHRQERRFMRHSPLLIWAERWRYPHPWGRVAPQTIPVDHYQYRSVEQMQTRWQTRYEAKEAGCGTFRHENTIGWEAYLWENRPLDIENAFLHAEKVIKKDRNEIREVSGVVIKSFAIPRGLKALMYSFFRKSKARRSYEYALRLNDLFGRSVTPSPIGYLEKTETGLLRESYYASERSVCPYTFRDLRDKSFPHRREMLEAVGRFTAELHEKGVLHGDYSQGNLLFDETGHIELVDLNRIHWRKHISLREGLHNMERLHLGDDEAFAIITRAYVAERETKK